MEHRQDAGATGDWTLPARLSVDRMKMKIRMKIGTRNGGDARFGGHVAGESGWFGSVKCET
jgi:hypothetical protein